MCRHSPREPVYIACDYEQDGVFYSAGSHGKPIAKPIADKNLGDDLETNEAEWTGKVEIKQRRNSWQ